MNNCGGRDRERARGLEGDKGGHSKQNKKHDQSQGEATNSPMYPTDAKAYDKAINL